MHDALHRGRHREVTAAPKRLRTLARRGLHTTVIAVIAGGTLAFADAATPTAAELAASASLTPAAAVAEGEAIDRSALGASRFEARSALGGLVAVDLVVDGEVRELTSQAATVADLLAEAGVVVDQDDVVSAPLATPLVAGMTIEVTTVETVDEHVSETDPHTTVEEEDDTLPRGERRVVTEGVDGVTATTYRVTVTGGEETGREVIARAVVSERVDEVVHVGTADPQPVAPAAPEASAGTPGPVVSGDPKAIAADMVAARGWGSDQFSCLDTLWERESNWNPLAENPSSGAYGIPQSLPGSKMASVGSDWRTNPATQITWGLNYIAGRYGTPCAALGHSNSVGWY